MDDKPSGETEDFQIWGEGVCRCMLHKYGRSRVPKLELLTWRAAHSCIHRSSSLVVSVDVCGDRAISEW